MTEGDLALAVDTKLRHLLPSLDGALAAPRIDFPTLRDQAERLRDTAAALTELLRMRLSSLPNAKLVAKLKARGTPALVPFGSLPQVLFGGATLEQLRTRYLEQIRAEAAAVKALAAEDKGARGLWMYWGDWEDGCAEGLPFFRAEALRDVLNELLKFTALLARTDAPTQLTAGPVLFSDDFQRLKPEWQVFGGAQVKAEQGALAVNGEACTVWLKQPIEDAVVAFDFTPLALEPKAGSLFAFPGNPLPGHTWLDSAGSMDLYNTRIETYHASLCRGNSGMTNLRRTGTGLRMLSTVQPDPCAALGKTYRIELLTWKGVAEVFVDGQLIHAYPDAGVYGPVLHKGHFGFRLFAGGAMSLKLSRLTINRLTAAAGK